MLLSHSPLSSSIVVNILKSAVMFMLALIVCCAIGPIGTNGVNITRGGKLFPIFQVVQFKNDPCVGSNNRNGTCYTSAECDSRGGVSSSTCAAGFGVCCLFSLACGSMSSENCTYLTQASTATVASNPCTYKICKCSDEVCRIRFDLTTFSIAGPNEGTAVMAPDVPQTSNGDVIGKCLTDQFSISAPGNFAPPVVCGFNSGQHMIVDASDECHEVRFNFGGSSARTWDIKVTQYKCGSALGGDDGCLQYFTGDSGTVASYNFPTQTSPLPPTTTHLVNQCYTMCWRQNRGKCGICWFPTTVGVAPVVSSFGVGNGSGREPRGEVDNKCRNDYLEIPEAVSITADSRDTFNIGTVSAGINQRDRLCGRIFSTAASSNNRLAAVSVCSQSRPFQMHFKTDDAEHVQDTISVKTNEQFGIPGGIVGFNLHWELINC